MNFHPYSEVFPLIEGPQFEELVEDIREHGLREKIWTYEGKILDGRNRFLACKKAKVKPDYREFRGTDALAFIVSLNFARRHLSDAQRAMAAARIATLKLGANQHAEGAPRGAPSQTEAAKQMDVSRRSVQRAKQVIEKGSKALQQAVDKGDVPLKRAAAVVDLPKAEQLKAATAAPQNRPPQQFEPEEPERPDDIDEDAGIASAEADFARRMDAVLKGDDKLAAAIAQLKQQSSLISTLEFTRDGYMRGKDEMTRRLKAEQRKCERLERENKKLLDEIEALRERVAIMEAA